MAIRIITDSTGDISAADGKALGIDIIPLSVVFGDKIYRDGIDLTDPQFFDMLAKAEKLPTTTQAPPSAFEGIFRKYVEQGDEIIGIFVSSKISGTFQSAVIAKGLVGSDNIYLVDSKSATLGMGMLVYEAVYQVRRGISAKEVAANIAALTDRVRFYAIVDTLKYLKMGGRVSSAAAAIGGILGIKPIVIMSDGRLMPAGKVKGIKAGYEHVTKQVIAEPYDPDYSVAFAHSNSPKLMDDLITYVNLHLPQPIPVNKIITGDIGCIIGTHCGPNCTGLAYIAK
ncbi:MAG: DegV family protein [Oscillospiraceae bacterium]